MRRSLRDTLGAAALAVAVPLVLGCEGDDAGMDDQPPPPAGQQQPGQQPPAGQQPGQQQPPAGAPGQQPMGEAPEIPDDELDRFADAYLEIVEVEEEMRADLQETEETEEVTQIQRDADEEMAGVLEDHDISRARFQEIIQILNADPQQRQEFEELVAEKQDGAPGGQ